MKSYKLTIIIICFLFFQKIVLAQPTVAGIPQGYNKNLKIIKSAKTKDFQITPPIKELSQILKEDKTNDSIGGSFRFGYPIAVDYNLQNSGEWLELENGDRIWRLIVNCPKAKSISFKYNKFWIPEGGTLYIYEPNMHKYIGGFSSKNNIGTKEIPKGFSTAMLKSEIVIIEYFEPKEVKDQGTINISQIIYGYRDLKPLTVQVPEPGACGCTGYRESCEIDVNCSDGNPSWQSEKTSVAKLVTGAQFANGIMVESGVAFCTGSLISNKKYDGRLLFLTANHCISHDNDAVEGTKKDLDWLFYWNYENTTCENDNQVSQTYVTYGARVLANSGFYTVIDKATGLPAVDKNGKIVYETEPPDFALLELKQSPYDLGFKAEYNGWERVDVPSRIAGAGIHHPDGKPKKISTGYINEYTSADQYISIDWGSSTYDKNVKSRLYGGSSGSPLFNNYHKVIGQCNSAWPLAYNPPFTNEYLDCTTAAGGVYGSLSYAWDFIRPATDITPTPISDERVRLKDWLDPVYKRSTVCYSMTCDVHPISGKIYTTTSNTTPITETWCKIEASNISILNNSSVIFDAANGVIITSDFVVPLTSSFEIK